MEFPSIRELIEDDLKATDALILERLRSDVVLINQIGHHIVNSGGKRLRPMIVLLVARALGYQEAAHTELAAIVEFIHTATLLHDDVVDSSDQRRNRDTANAVWGNSASVLVGDFLYSRSFQMMVSVNSMPVMEVMSQATNRIAEGEVLQLLNCNDPDTDENRYREVILRKTATLFEASAQLGAIISGAQPDLQRTLADYGRHLGMAFQMVDDALDYGAAGREIGKNLGDDLAEGKPTLPLIRAIGESNPTTKDMLRQAIQSGGTERIEEVLSAIESTDALAYTARLASDEATKAKQALDAVPPSAYRSALVALADFSVDRSF